MLLRKRVNGAIYDAELLLQKVGNQRPQFILVARDATHGRVEVGKLAAAIGYELVSASGAEKAALLLARFHVPLASAQGNGLARVTATLPLLPALELAAGDDAGAVGNVRHDAPAQAAQPTHRGRQGLRRQVDKQTT